jgi:anthranilate phosphoribosyltransferase
MITSALNKITNRQDLSEEEAGDVMRLVMDGQPTPAQLGALLGALRTKGETADELAGFARAMRERAIPVKTSRRLVVDVCGTGGDGAGTFNISTAAAFVVASAGIPVAKHGNRAVSSRCGSADVLAGLGVRLDLTPEQIGMCVDRVGIGFLYAPSHHPAMSHAAQTRRELAIRTTFNIVGPMTNPAGANCQLVGVFDPELCPVVAEALGRLGTERAMVVHGMDGLDEISTIGPTRISTLQNGRVSTDTRIPAEFYVVPATLQDIAGGATVEENVRIIISVLQGELGPRRDIVAANAAAGLILGGMAESWRDGVALANRLLSSGKALNCLKELIAFTRQFETETA